MRWASPEASASAASRISSSTLVHAARAGPVEVHSRRLALDALRPQQRRQRAGDAVEERSAQSSLVGFALLDGLPLSEGFGRRADRRVTEYVRVTAHHLVDELPEQIAHGELA